MSILTVEDLSFSYEKKRGDNATIDGEWPQRPLTLQSIALTFHPGRFYSILGPNGCGKTTLMDLFIGHLSPTKGRVLLKGKSISDCSRINIAKQIALVAQNDAVNFPFSVKEVVMMGRHPHIKRFAQPTKKDWQRVEEVMVLTEIDRFGSRKITELSGGERQRVLFARALCQDTPLLFLDEAFSNMDIHHTIRLLDRVKKEVIENQKTVISVFHDINFATIWSDILIFMKEGRVVAHGKSASVLSETLIEEVFHVKPQVRHHPYANAKQVCFRSELTPSTLHIEERKL